MPESKLPEDPILQAWRAGYEYGKASRVEQDIEDEIQRRMHEEALWWGGFARHHALRRHGPAWAALVCGDDEKGAA